MLFETNQNTHVSFYLLNSTHSNISFANRSLLCRSQNTEKSHFSPVDIFPSWSKSCWRRGKRNYRISGKMVSIFVPLVIKTRILLFKIKLFKVFLAKTVLPPPPQSPAISASGSWAQKKPLQNSHQEHVPRSAPEEHRGKELSSAAAVPGTASPGDWQQPSVISDLSTTIYIFPTANFLREDIHWSCLVFVCSRLNLYFLTLNSLISNMHRLFHQPQAAQTDAVWRVQPEHFMQQSQILLHCGQKLFWFASLPSGIPHSVSHTLTAGKADVNLRQSPACSCQKHCKLECLFCLQWPDLPQYSLGDFSLPVCVHHYLLPGALWLSSCIFSASLLYVMKTLV